MTSLTANDFCYQRQEVIYLIIVGDLRKYVHMYVKYYVIHYVNHSHHENI